MFARLSNRHPLLPTLVILVVVFILIAVGLVITFIIFPDRTPEVAEVPTIASVTVIPTRTPSSTPTITLTPRPTWTLGPSSTPTETPSPTDTVTPPPLPTLRSANPLNNNDLYFLRSWSPEQANDMIDLLESYPNSLFRTEEDRDSLPYYQAFTPAVIAQREALLRYPDDPLVEAWQWDMAYNLARMNHPQAGARYAQIITSALEAGDTELDSLSIWFMESETRLNLHVLPSNQTNGALVQVAGEGSAYIWIEKTRSDFDSVVITTNFDYPGDIQPGYLYEDITGDGKPDVITFSSPPSGSTVLPEPLVISLSGGEPEILPRFDTPPFDAGLEFEGRWTVTETGLRHHIRLFPSCPVAITRDYFWESEQLHSDPLRFEIQPDPELSEHCASVIQHSESIWGAEVTSELMESLRPYWPPQTDTEGKQLPPDALNEYLYKLAIMQAFSGKRDTSIQTFQEITSDPAGVEDQWVEASQNFLSIYTSDQDVYRACNASPECDPRMALRYIVSTIPESEYNLVTGYLNDFGVALRSSGFFDFENDGDPERWILVQHQPAQKLEFWILVKNPSGTRAFFINLVDSNTVEPWLHEPVEDPPIAQIERGQGFVIRRAPNSNEAYLTFIEVSFVPTTYTKDIFEAAVEELFSGEDPRIISDRLESLRESDRYNCRNYNLCEQFLYILGLSNELAGQDKDAINSYISLWWEHKSSLYTVMARTKLDQFATPTRTTRPTNTPLPTRTPIPTRTQPPTPTP